MRIGTPGFLGERLKEAREARTMTAITLADIVGVARASISQYEHGHQSPPPDVLRKMSVALNVPVHRFIKPIPPRERGVIFYRCMSAATKKARLRAERRYEWLREIVCYLEQYVKFPAVNFPDFGLPAEPTRIHQEQIEELAEETRKFWNLQNGPISNVMWLIESHGATASRSELEASTLDAFSEWDPISERPHFMLGSDKNCAVRSRFDAAHELAHMILHRRIPKSMLNQNDAFALVEQQADQFATAFLLPATSFSDDFFAPTLDSLRLLKERWRVSIGAMVKRAATLKLISEQQEQRLWINIGRRKWRMKEPLDDVLEVERPRFLRRCVETLIERKVINPHDLPFQLGLSAADVEALSCLKPGTLVDQHVDVSLHDDMPLLKESGDEPLIFRFPSAS